MSLTNFRKLCINNQATNYEIGDAYDKGYQINFINTSSMQELPWRNDLSFNIIQLEDMTDHLAQETANQIIKEASTSWIKGITTEAAPVYSDIYMHSNQYLSFRNRFTYSGINQSDYVSNYFTIDIKNRKRVMLSDLVEINAEFIQYIQNNFVVKRSERPYSNEFDNDSVKLFQYLQEMPPDELLERFEGCSKTEEEILVDEDMSNYTSIGALVLRNSFYLRRGKLVIVIGDKKTIKSSKDRREILDGIHLTFELQDISDFLKVEPW